jgi:hypothetical protein
MKRFMNQRIAKYQSVPAIAPAIAMMTTPAAEVGPCIQSMPAVQMTAKTTDASTKRRCGDIDLSIGCGVVAPGGGEARRTWAPSRSDGAAPL